MLKRKSSVELEKLAKEAISLANDLKGKQPSYELALINGVKNIGYRTVRYGWISSYSGEAIITMENGSQWKAIGHRPTGTAEFVSKSGYIEFQLL